MEKENKNWYQKKGYIVVIFILGLIAINVFAQNGSTSQSTTPSTQYNNSAYTPATTTPAPNLSNNNYYTNTYGNSVHSPAYSDNGSVPSGASARCRDGTYSFSQHRSGTCSYHGGVSEWL